MKNISLKLILIISTAYLAFPAHAEEPFIGIGYVNGIYTQDVNGPVGTENDADVSMNIGKLTLGTRISPHVTIEGYYLSTFEAGDDVLGSGLTDVEFEVESAVGAYIHLMSRLSIFTFYGGVGVNAAKMQATADDATIQATYTNSTQVSPGFSIGIDTKIYKKFSMAIHAEQYIWDSDTSALGGGLELRWHL